MVDPSKTEKATPRRRSETRDKGQVAKSQEFNTAILFVLALVLLRLYLPRMNAVLQSSTHELWSTFPRELTVASFMDIMWQMGLGIFMALAPLFLFLLIGALLVNIAQVGLKVSLYPLKPNLNKLSPISGFKRLFSLQPLVQLGINLIKMSLIVWLSWSILNAHYNALLQSVQMDLDQTGILLGAIVWEIGWKIGLAMLVLAIGDLAWQRWYHERNLRMSKQEIKDEHKNMDGDPQIKARIRQLQRKAAQNRMMDAIPRADVILTNPVHLAVALAYDPAGMNAPQVLAKGAAAVAERIKERAREYDVPIIENKPLARALFRSTEVGGEVPAELYAAISEVLIYVYQLTGRLDEYMES